MTISNAGITAATARRFVAGEALMHFRNIRLDAKSKPMEGGKLQGNTKRECQLALQLHAQYGLSWSEVGALEPSLVMAEPALLGDQRLP
jgi:hypothetical protein